MQENQEAMLNPGVSQHLPGDVTLNSFSYRSEPGKNLRPQYHRWRNREFKGPEVGASLACLGNTEKVFQR